MLARFDLENWMSFRDRASFSMIATRERQYRDRVPLVGKYSTHILPVAALYGGNASGKTNFFSALGFIQRLVVDGIPPDALIPVEPFRLEPGTGGRPTRFRMDILIDESIYEFSVSLTQKRILEEKLVLVSAASERTLYHRQDGKPNFHRSLLDDGQLAFAFQGTRPNQLFLTNSVTQNIAVFKPIYDWFRDSLILIAPDSRFLAIEHFIDSGTGVKQRMSELLTQLDTGITSLGEKEIPFDAIPVPEMVRQQIGDDLLEGESGTLIPPADKDRYIVSRKHGRLLARKLITFHESREGKSIPFEMRRESDGSQRLIDLLPLFLSLTSAQSKKLIVIDELDRSLHTLLTRRLLKYYLDTCDQTSRCQLFFTTHDVLLMDQSLLRRDEMWVTERDSAGSSKLFSFSEFKDVRYDKDIRRSYLQGRLGGIPRILMSSGNPGKES